MLGFRVSLSEHPLSTRLDGILFGAAITVASAGLCISARAAPGYLSAIAFIAIISLFRHYHQTREFLASRLFGTFKGKIGLLSVLSLLTWALTSALWSEDQLATIKRVATAFAVLGCVIMTLPLVARLDRLNVAHVIEGLWIGFAIGICFLFAEVVSGQAILRFLINALEIPESAVSPAALHTWRDGTLVAIHADSLSRNFAPTTLLLWPSLFVLGTSFPGPEKSWVRFLLFGIAFVAIFLSQHESSKLALIVGSLIFTIAIWRRKWIARLMVVYWIALCFLTVPIVLSLHHLGLHKEPWVMESARQRVEIWRHSAESIRVAPWFGTGARSTYVRTAARSKLAGQKEFAYTHQHSLYLQVWQELGTVGAVLLFGIGLSWILAIQLVPTSLQPYGYAALGSGSALLATSYGLWQSWLLALFGIIAICFNIARKASEIDCP